MTQPAAPLRLQVLDRIVTVLAAIVAGADYFYTPYAVTRRLILPDECKGFPTYSVHPDTGGTITYDGACGDETTYDESFFVNVKGIVKHATDVPTMLERALRDVRHAIDVDARAKGTPGSLGYICVECRIEEPPETDNGFMSLDNFGYFEQRIRCVTTGKYGEL